MTTKSRQRGEGGVENGRNFVDVIYGCPLAHMDSDKLKGCPFPQNNYLSLSTLLKENALLCSCTITLSLPPWNDFLITARLYILITFFKKKLLFQGFFCNYERNLHISGIEGGSLHWFVVPVGFFSWKAWYGNDPRDTSITLDGRKVCCVCVQYRKSFVADSWLVIG